MELRTHASVELMKNDVNDNGISVQTVDPRRIGKVGPSLCTPAVTPATQLIRGKPPQELHYVRSPNFGNLMPLDAAHRSPRSARTFNHVVHVFDTLGIKMNFPVELRGEALDLLHDAKFCSMTSVEKGRNDSEAHVMRPRLFGTDLGREVKAVGS